MSSGVYKYVKYALVVQIHFLVISCRCSCYLIIIDVRNQIENAVDGLMR